MLTWLHWPLWRGLGQSLFSLALAYVFIVILMTATAQQRVLSNLDGAGLDYSSALLRVEEAEARDEELKAFEDSERALIDEQFRRQQALVAARAAEKEAWDAFAPLAARLSAPNVCGPAPDEDHMSVWNHVIQCLRDGRLDERSARQVEAAIAIQPSAADTYREARQAADDVQATEERLGRKREDIAAAQADIAQAQQLRQAFAEMRTIRGSWLLGGGILTPFPPTMMQIVMASSAGAFGALLITLVLAVYPHNEFNFAVGGAYYSRILLGALISVCVYIMISGGSAILGDTRPFDTGRMNVMTFSAIGVLAGMFSDRVALWLSERASLFFAARTALAPPMAAPPPAPAPRIRRAAAGR